MPEYEYPGVYVEETSFRARSIEGVPTSGTAFVFDGGDESRHGSVVTLREHADLARQLPEATAALDAPVRLFFENGGTDLHVLGVAAADPLGPQLSALDDVHGLGLLCVPGESDMGRLQDALAYADRRRLFLLVDPPDEDPNAAAALTAALAGSGSANAAVFFPPLVVKGASVVPSGAVAGLYARTDRTRGVWKAPAGVEAGVLGVDGPAVSLTDQQTETLSRVGVNTIRSFASAGTVVWGARTVQGADAGGSEWKYVPVRRLASYLEESLSRGTQWAVFEPNDEPLWAELRQQAGDFVYGLWKAGAFAGQTPALSFFVRCDRTTMTQDDLDNGRVVIEVGFAPLKPAEFVIIRIQHLTTTDPPPTTVTVTGSEVGATIRLPHRPVLTEGFRLEVDSGPGWAPWSRVPGLDEAAPDEPAFVLDPDAGEVRFGDGRHGAALPSGASVRATYRRGGGAAGNAAPDPVGRVVEVVGRELRRWLGLVTGIARKP